MAKRADDPAFQFHGTGRAFKRATGSVRDIATLANRRMDAELELLGHRDLNLRIFARGTENPDALDSTFWSDDGQLFLAGVLAGLGEIGVFRELVAWTEE